MRVFLIVFALGSLACFGRHLAGGRHFAIPATEEGRKCAANCQTLYNQCRWGNVPAMECEEQSDDCRGMCPGAVRTD